MTTSKLNKEIQINDEFNICLKIKDCDIFNENEMKLVFCLPNSFEWVTH
jgi:hypothetical protein